MRSTCAVPPPMREHAHVARHAFQRQVARIAARAEHLQRVVDDLDRAFRTRRSSPAPPASDRETRCYRGRASAPLVEHQPRRGELGLHVGEHPLQALEFADRPAELLAVLRPVERMIERAGGDAHAPPCRRRRAGCCRRSSGRQSRGGSRTAAAPPCSAGTSRSSNMISPSGMPRSPMVCSRLPTRRPFASLAHREEAADAELLAALVEHAREDQMQPRYAGAGDPVLLAVDDVAVAALVGARGHRGRVAAGLRLGDADRRLVAARARAARPAASAPRCRRPSRSRSRPCWSRPRCAR